MLERGADFADVIRSARLEDQIDRDGLHWQAGERPLVDDLLNVGLYVCQTCRDLRERAWTVK